MKRFCKCPFGPFIWPVGGAYVTAVLGFGVCLGVFTGFVAVNTLGFIVVNTFGLVFPFVVCSFVDGCVLGMVEDVTKLCAEDDEGGPNVGYVGVGPGPITEKKFEETKIKNCS